MKVWKTKGALRRASFGINLNCVCDHCLEGFGESFGAACGHFGSNSRAFTISRYLFHTSNMTGLKISCRRLGLYLANYTLVKLAESPFRKNYVYREDNESYNLQSTPAQQKVTRAWRHIKQENNAIGLFLCPTQDSLFTSTTKNVFWNPNQKIERNNSVTFFFLQQKWWTAYF